MFLYPLHQAVIWWHRAEDGQATWPIIFTINLRGPLKAAHCADCGRFVGPVVCLCVSVTSNILLQAEKRADMGLGCCLLQCHVNKLGWKVVHFLIGSTYLWITFVQNSYSKMKNKKIQMCTDMFYTPFGGGKIAQWLVSVRVSYPAIDGSRQLWFGCFDNSHSVGVLSIHQPLPSTG